MMQFGQYSVVSFTHALRGDRINLGVLVWHPSLGYDFRFTTNIRRVRCIDEDADTTRVSRDFESIKQTMKGWMYKGESPLDHLAHEFRFGLQVSAPQNARIYDPTATLERLYLTLIQPAPEMMRAAAATQFAKSFASTFEKELIKKGVTGIRRAIEAETSFQPVPITLAYEMNGEWAIWRTCSFASESEPRLQLRLAKAFYAENADLKSSVDYRAAHLRVAAQMPKPHERGASWAQALSWLERDSVEVQTFEDTSSIPQKVQQLIAALP